MIELKPPSRVNGHFNSLTKIFLAGSIEMGLAENWQSRVVQDLKDEMVLLFNPRRDDWDATWIQRADNPQFSEQVNWELDSLEESDIIIFYFDVNTKSPITLMELGYFAGIKRFMGHQIIVCCPDEFWRKGNVDIVCNRLGFKVVTTYDDMMKILHEEIKHVQKKYWNATKRATYE